MKKTYLILVGFILVAIQTQAQNDTWAIIMGEDPNAQQSYKGSAEFPVEYIREKRTEGLYIADLTYGNGEWVVTMASRAYTGQTYKKSKSFPAT